VEDKIYTFYWTTSIL